MDRSPFAALIALLAVGLPWTLPQPARAQGLPQAGLAHAPASQQPRLRLALRYSDSSVLGVEGAQAVQASERPAPSVPRECKPKYMVGPGMGVPLGLGAFMGGVMLVTVGNFDLWEPDPKTRSDRALIASGSIVMAGGLATFVYSTVKLSKNRHARRRICASAPRRGGRADKSP